MYKFIINEKVEAEFTTNQALGEYIIEYTKRQCQAEYILNQSKRDDKIRAIGFVIGFVFGLITAYVLSL